MVLGRTEPVHGPHQMDHLGDRMEGRDWATARRAIFRCTDLLPTIGDVDGWSGVDFSRRGVVLYSQADAADEDIRLYARVDDAAVSVQATEPSTAGGRLTPLAMT